METPPRPRTHNNGAYPLKRPHPSPSDSSRQPPSKKIPEFQFRGVWLPPQVLIGIQDGSISRTDLLILALIEAYTYPGSQGCFASNQYLGKHAGVGPMPASRAVSKLIRLRLVVGSGAGRSRRLGTTWGLSTMKAGTTEHIPGGYMQPIPAGYTRSEAMKRTNTGPQMRAGVSATTEPAMAIVDDEVLVDFGTKPAKKGDPTPVDLENAQRLRDALTTKNLHTPHWSKAAWANQMRMLRTAEGEDPVKEALAWFCEHVGEEFVPQAYSGEGFRKKYIAIREAMKRDRKRHPKVEVTPQAVAITRRLAMLGWPKGTEAALPAVVQVGINAACGLRDQLTRFLENPSTRRLELLAERILDLHLPDPGHFVEIYMQGVRDRLKRWESWSGHLGQFAFDPTSDEFKKTARGWAAGYSDPDDWDRLYKELADV